MGLVPTRSRGRNHALVMWLRPLSWPGVESGVTKLVGAQAVAALAMAPESVPRVDKSSAWNIYVATANRRSPLARVGTT